MESIKLTVKQIILQFKTLLKSPIQVLLILLIPFLITTTLPIFFFGMKDSYGVTVTLSVSIVVFILYSYFVGEYRKSTLYKNLQSTKSNKWIFNLSSFVSIFIIGILVFFFHFALMFIYSKLNLLQVSILKKLNTDINEIQMFQLPFMWTVYWVSVIIGVSFSISFALYRVVKEAKTYYITIIIIVILGIIFDSTFNNYFMTSAWSNGEVMDSLFFGGSVRALFPNSFYWPSIIYPFYAPSQMLTVAGMKTLVNKSDGLASMKYIAFWKWQVNSDYIAAGLNPNAWRWNLLYFLPYIHSSMWIASGISISKLSKK